MGECEGWLVWWGGGGGGENTAWWDNITYSNQVPRNGKSDEGERSHNLHWRGDVTYTEHVPYI